MGTCLFVHRITQAFVLGAGLGTRLRPLTGDLPKPLLPIFQKPLITFALDHLIDLGIESFVINTHKLAEAFTDFFTGGTYRGHPVNLIHEPNLLETGGGIKNAQSYLDGAPFITYSGDILTDIDLQQLIEEHLQRDNDVTLALRQTGLATGIAFRNSRIVDICQKYGVTGNYDFANLAVWNPSIFSRIPPGKKISFIPILADWIGGNGRIGGIVLDQGRWFNISSRSEYLQVHRTILEENWKPAYVTETDWPERIAKSAQIDPTAKVLGSSAVGTDCRVGKAAVLEDTILWPGAQIAFRSHLCRCIVRSRRNVAGLHHDADL